MSARLLLLVPTASYRTGDFLAAASALGVDLVVATEEPSSLEPLSPSRLVTLPFADPAAAAAAAAVFAARVPLAAVLGVDDETAEAAAAIAQRLGLRGNDPAATRAARDKSVQRATHAAAGVRVPDHLLWRFDEPLDALLAEAPYPCVAKPLFLSGSRGVIRADDPVQLRAATERIRRLLARADLRRRGGERAGALLVERYIDGVEFALEGMLEDGQLLVTALFDKPDPLTGPFFEETLYVTPSRLAADAQEAIAATVQRAAAALGLAHGPVHAELRLDAAGQPWVLEVAARSIGGLCSRTLRFGDGVSLEEVIVRQSLGLPWRDLPRAAGASGVLMVPIPRAGRLRDYGGLDDARRLDGIEAVTLTARRGSRLVPLPEGDRYLGFVFARAATPDAVEAALRAAHATLRFDIEGD